MMTELPEAGRPYIRFFTEAVENRENTLKVGFPQFDSVNFVCVLMAGGRDTVVKNAEDWLEDSRLAVKAQRLSSAWYNEYKSAYEQFQSQEALKAEGFWLNRWPGITVGQVATCAVHEIFTVEALAKTPEDILPRLGDKGAHLKALAIAYLEAAAGPGVAAAKVVDLQETIVKQEKVIQNLRTSLDELKLQVKADKK